MCSLRASSGKDGRRLRDGPAVAAAGPFRELAQLALSHGPDPMRLFYELTLIVRSLLLPTFLAIMVPLAC
jgi:hypothetical protein